MSPLFTCEWNTHCLIKWAGYIGHSLKFDTKHLTYGLKIAYHVESWIALRLNFSWTCFLNGTVCCRVPDTQPINAICKWIYSLQWRHNERDGVSKHRYLHCLLNCCFMRRSKKTSKLRVTGLCAENAPVIGEFPVEKASVAENVYMYIYVCVCVCDIQMIFVTAKITGRSPWWLTYKTMSIELKILFA